MPKIKLGLLEISNSKGEGYQDKVHGIEGKMSSSGRNPIEELRHLPGGERLVDNNDNAGNSIISKITRSLGSLKTLSGAADLLNEGNRNFNLFSHH